MGFLEKQLTQNLYWGLLLWWP